MKKVVGALAALLVALVWAGVSAYGGAQASPPATNTNHPSYWVTYFNNQGYADVECVKYEPVNTPFVVPAPDAGEEWLAAVIKAGSGASQYDIRMGVQAGDLLSHATGKDNSFVILCSVPGGQTPPSSSMMPTP